MPGAGLEPARHAAGDFKSPASTDFATRAGAGCGNGREDWRRGSESNRRPRLCRPLHDHSATPPGGARRASAGPQKQKRENHGFPSGNLERETSLELATSTLARLRSTN